MKIIKLVSVFLAVSVLMGCAHQSQADLKTYYARLHNADTETSAVNEISTNETAEDLTIADATQSFQELYGLTSLTGQTLFRDQETAQMAFYFEEDAPFYQIDTARSYVIMKFVLGQLNDGSRVEYEHWLAEDGKPKEFPEILCKIYVNDRLLLEDHYENKQVSSCYENNQDYFQLRSFVPEEQDALSEVIRKCTGSSDILFQKSILNGTLIITVKTDKYISPEKTEQLLDELNAWKDSNDTVAVSFLINEECYYTASLNEN